MSQKLKVTFTTIEIINNGEWTNKGEVYHDLRVNGTLVSSRSSNNPQKVADGDNIDLSASYIVTLADSQRLIISGTVKERDNLDKDESASFSQEFTKASGWGIGSQSAPARDGKLDVKVHYQIEKA